jgi:hypothetical protein
VTYGGSNPIVTQNTNQVVNSMNYVGEFPEGITDPNAPDAQKKNKSLPVCN